jgi:hypothetical protein
MPHSRFAIAGDRRAWRSESLASATPQQPRYCAITISSNMISRMTSSISTPRLPVPAGYAGGMMTTGVVSGYLLVSAARITSTMTIAIIASTSHLLSLQSRDPLGNRDLT